MKLDELKAIRAKMTPVPYKKCNASGGHCKCGLIWSNHADVVVFHEIAANEDNEGVTHEQACLNGQGIVATHNAFDELVKRYEEMRAALQIIDGIDWVIGYELTDANIAVIEKALEAARAALTNARKPLEETR